MCVCVCYKKLPNLKCTLAPVETTNNPHIYLKQQYDFDILPQLCSVVSLNNCLFVWNWVGVCVCEGSKWISVHELHVLFV